MPTSLSRRPRRLRQSSAVRALVEETTLSVNDFIYPMFVVEGQNVTSEVSSMPGIFRYSLDRLLEELTLVTDLGIKAVDLFPNYQESKKDKIASESHREGTFYLETIHAVKTKFPNLLVMTDVAMDPYSSDGHDGLVAEARDGSLEILNDETLEILGRMSIAQAQAGADFIGPSDMMDGRVAYIRRTLDAAGFPKVGIISYTAKYASAFYGPFRDALDSAPKFGDKKTYQMNPANAREALVEAELDYAEGADMLMVKPALAYLDIIKALHDQFDVPIAAYNVSGEYSMVKAAAERGWLDPTRGMLEVLTSIKRAGANVILSYFAKEFAMLK